MELIEIKHVLFYLSHMYHQRHPLTMTQTALIPHHQYIILEVLEPSGGLPVLRILERSGRFLCLFLNQKPFVS